MRLAVLGVVFILVMDEGPGPLRVAAAAIAAAIVAAWLGQILLAAIVRWRRRSRYGSAVAKARALVAEHIETLARRQLALERTDRYGVVDRTAWQKELQHFARNVVVPRLSRAERDEVSRRGMAAFVDRELAASVAARVRERRGTLEVATAVDATEFEIACANALIRLGWRAEVTAPSGDQGADVIATKGATCAVVQCKMYTGAVGNAAVQEVLAAKLFYAADVAAVVATSTYTKSAARLADRCDVLLLTADEIADFDRLIARRAMRSPQFSRPAEPRASRTSSRQRS